MYYEPGRTPHDCPEQLKRPEQRKRPDSGRPALF